MTVFLTTVCSDTQFFNIPLSEAEAIDPQQRLLMETVFESLESAGMSIENLSGSNTAVYVGVMCDDFSQIGMALFRVQVAGPP